MINKVCDINGRGTERIMAILYRKQYAIYLKILKREKTEMYPQNKATLGKKKHFQLNVVLEEISDLVELNINRSSEYFSCK